MFRRLLPLVVWLLAPWSVRSNPVCRDDLLDADGYTIRSVTVEGRWVPAIALALKPGDRFTNAKVQAAMEAVQAALRGDNRADFELQNLGAIGVLHITRCLMVEGKEVDVIIQPRALRIDLFRVGNNVLPIPRAGFATFYDAVPAPLRALNPTLGFSEDKRYGFAPNFGLTTDLPMLPGAAASANASKLEVIATGRKSVEHSFYNAEVHLALTSLHPGEFLQQTSLELAYTGADEPRGDTSATRQAGEIGGSLRLKPDLGLIQTVIVGANYRWSHNRFGPGGVLADTDESAGQLRALAEGRAGGGFLRAALWADGGAPDRGWGYARIAGLIGFEKEFLVAPNQTIGVEAIIGGGKAWSAPSYARFYGGNSERDFLYENLQAPSLAAFPSGPIIRSLGEGETLARGNSRGASDYWHVNLNITPPISRLSMPLIPDEEVLPGLSLKRLLKNKAGDAVSHLAVEFEEEGLSPEAALAKAKAIYGGVQPAVEFVADRANVYALKPLLLCDVAGQDGNGGQRVAAAVGGGLQLTIVTAKMEVGYMQTVAGERSGTGNFFGRIVFENIF
ncbi:MAG: hypothetical protein ACR2HH_03585 [Chthoniobacterales bacterium]